MFSLNISGKVLCFSLSSVATRNFIVKSRLEVSGFNCNCSETCDWTLDVCCKLEANWGLRKSATNWRKFTWIHGDIIESYSTQDTGRIQKLETATAEWPKSCCSYWLSPISSSPKSNIISSNQVWNFVSLLSGSWLYGWSKLGSSLRKRYTYGPITLASAAVEQSLANQSGAKSVQMWQVNYTFSGQQCAGEQYGFHQ